MRPEIAIPLSRMLLLDWMLPRKPSGILTEIPVGTLMVWNGLILPSILGLRSSPADPSVLWDGSSREGSVLHMSTVIKLTFLVSFDSFFHFPSFFQLSSFFLGSLQSLE